MENLVNIIGGYGSWQFAVISLGCFFIGGGLMFWKFYFFPIFLFGATLMLVMLTNEISITTFTDSRIGGIASIIPIIFIAGCLIAIMQAAIKYKPTKEKKP
jgi:hypothetical protein